MNRDDAEAAERSSRSITFKDLRQVAGGHLHHESETAYYVLLSVLDFLLTYTLITTGDGAGRQFTEANPVAAWFLNHYGFVKGLLPFKLAVVLFVCIISQIVSLKQPRLGRLLLSLGIAVSLWVVVYSVRLLLGA